MDRERKRERGDESRYEKERGRKGKESGLIEAVGVTRTNRREEER